MGGGLEPDDRGDVAEAAEAGGDVAEAADASAIPRDDEAWLGWLRLEVQQSPAYSQYHELLEECCSIAATWRKRFWERKGLWSRIRHGSRLAKELSEAAPVLARAKAQVEALELDPTEPRVTVIDLCSGFGYLGMFLSELLPCAKVERIVLVDIMWAPQNVERKPHHLNPEHIDDPGWPIRLTTSRADLKSPSDRRSLGKAFLSHGGPAIVLGVHLCSTLSLRAIDLFNDCPGCFFLALKPCCLPDIGFAKRGDVFSSSAGHCFPAAAVAVRGKWQRGKWVNGAGRPELEKKFGCWVDNLSRCIECSSDDADAARGANIVGGGGAGQIGQAGARARTTGGGVRNEHHLVQSRWYQNRFIFASRHWRPLPPRSSTAALGQTQSDSPNGLMPTGVPLPNMSNRSGVPEARRAAVVEAFQAELRQAKRNRRAARRAEQCDDGLCVQAEAMRRARESKALRVSLEPLGRDTVCLQLCLEVHHGTFVVLGSGRTAS